MPEQNMGNIFPSKPVLSLEGFFMRWSKTVALLLIRSGSYIHSFVDKRG